jgi:hypothetical protein
VAYVVRVNDRQEKQIDVVSVHERAINKQESHVNSEDSTDNEHVSLFSRHLQNTAMHRVLADRLQHARPVSGSIYRIVIELPSYRKLRPAWEISEMVWQRDFAEAQTNISESGNSVKDFLVRELL